MDDCAGVVRGETPCCVIGAGDIGLKDPVPDRLEGYVWKECHEDRFGHLLLTGMLSDVDLILSPKGAPPTIIKAHKLILSTGSRVFAQLIQKSGDLTSIQITEDVDPAVFAEFLRFLYVGNLNLSVELESKAPLVQLIQLALKYEVADLGIQCSSILLKYLNDESVIELYQLAIENELPALHRSAFEYICRHAMDLVETDQFLELNFDNLCHLLTSDNLEVFNEIQLFNAVIKWGENECKKKDIKINPESLCQVLGEALKRIRFPTMDQKDFTLNVAAKKMLQLEDLVSVLLSFTLPIEERCLMSDGKFNGALRRFLQDKIEDWQNHCTTLKRFPERKISTAFRAMDVPDTVKFQVDRNIRFMGIGAIGFSIEGAVLEASITIVDDEDKMLISKSKCMLATNLQKVNFERGCKIVANRWYTVTILLNNSAIDTRPLVGIGGKSVGVVKLKHLDHLKSKNLQVVFNFEPIDEEDGDVQSGIIDEFYFMLI